MLTDAILTDFGGGLVRVGVADTPPSTPGPVGGGQAVPGGVWGACTGVPTTSIVPMMP